MAGEGSIGQGCLAEVGGEERLNEVSSRGIPWSSCTLAVQLHAQTSKANQIRYLYGGKGREGGGRNKPKHAGACMGAPMQQASKQATASPLDLNPSFLYPASPPPVSFFSHQAHHTLASATW